MRGESATHDQITERKYSLTRIGFTGLYVLRGTLTGKPQMRLLFSYCVTESSRCSAAVESSPAHRSNIDGSTAHTFVCRLQN